MPCAEPVPKAPRWPVLVAARSWSPKEGMSVPVGKAMELGESRLRFMGPWKEGRAEEVLARARRSEGMKGVRECILEYAVSNRANERWEEGSESKT